MAVHIKTGVACRRPVPAVSPRSFLVQTDDGRRLDSSIRHNIIVDRPLPRARSALRPLLVGSLLLAAFAYLLTSEHAGFVLLPLAATDRKYLGRVPNVGANSTAVRDVSDDVLGGTDDDEIDAGTLTKDRRDGPSSESLREPRGKGGTRDDPADSPSGALYLHARDVASQFFAKWGTKPGATDLEADGNVENFRNTTEGSLDEELVVLRENQTQTQDKSRSEKGTEHEDGRHPQTRPTPPTRTTAMGEMPALTTATNPTDYDYYDGEGDER